MTEENKKRTIKLLCDFGYEVTMYTEDDIWIGDLDLSEIFEDENHTVLTALGAAGRALNELYEQNTRLA